MTDWGMIVGDRRTWVRDIAYTAGSSLVLALLAPFGTDRLPLEQRLVEYFAIGFASFVLLWPPMRLALRLGDRAGLPELFVLVGGLVILTLPVTLMGILIVGLFGHPGPPGSLVTTYFMVLVMVLPFGAAYLMIERRLMRPTAVAVLPERATATPTRLLARLSPRLGRNVLALQAEDHYVRVHTALGSELLLMRFGDGIAELEGMAGERVHRSWWVAREAVGTARVNGRRASLVLTNGLEIPVSRDATSRLRRAGWLKS